ncbi:hypothetical protein FJQ98_18335 [Lysinibacillus agricola]|uniref:Uncharacterized protein n=1 Tax=Lysinibacillus agricola TaxID=2590012 RepID=A0ABX7ANR1_9BACI|nr:MULTISPECIES: hypothetical protein [Lysinibacillus]KOS60599.1 hypothetical protein AN161_22275 [Lysinibacillus sp. FJAT-14222]QQP11171.1 hypothetical protein FJQ98_18335 [Lysinibacillus agricola]
MRRELKILPKIGINEVKLSMTSSDLKNIIGELDKKNVNGKEFFLYQDEYIFHFVDDVLVSISVNNPDVIFLNNQKIDLMNESKQFLFKENPYFVDGCYIFPQYNMSIYGLDFPDDGIQLTIYSDNQKNIYEKDIKLAFQFRSIDNQLINLKYEITPYQSVGLLKFGMQLSEIEKIWGVPLKISKNKKKGITTENRTNSQAMYNEKGQLIQLALNCKEEVFIDNKLLSKFGSKLDSLKNEEYFINRNYKIYFKFGIALDNLGNLSSNDFIYIFSEEMIPYWNDIYRPLI